MAEEIGYPYNQIPPEIFEPYRGGIYSWGSICGALVPPISFIKLVVGENEAATKLVNEIMAWYKEFPFPEYQPQGMDLPQIAVDSSLCHVSVTKWMNVAGVDRDTPERKERCGGLTADVTKKTVEMLNQLYDEGVFENQFKPTAIVGECMACHSKIEPYAHGKETCTSCHDDHTKN